jgi:hypothetical protein
VQVLQPSNREQLPMELGFTVKQIGACRVAVQRRDPAVLGKADVRLESTKVIYLTCCITTA